jgi:hypothetical protein
MDEQEFVEAESNVSDLIIELLQYCGEAYEEDDDEIISNEAAEEQSKGSVTGSVKSDISGTASGKSANAPFK